MAKIPRLKQNTSEFLFLAQNLDPILVSEIFLGCGPVDFVLTSGERLKRDYIINKNFSETFFANKFFISVWSKVCCIRPLILGSITFSGNFKCFDKRSIMIGE